ncbi:hypothetical protein GQ53DRAFT_786770 [Thozetella sp. PMI_491]|nr:hypothetical protein GQ53DRAFT_786770 [Thozetella sp. PMI_491]
MASHHGSGGGGPHKITKSRPKVPAAVKPILKKLASSEKNSLDLDRPWDEQTNAWAGGYDSNAGPSVAFGPDEVVGSVGGGSRKFHVRSTSQTSNGSNPRGGFVHPFQQTPRTSTPPLSYANSLASFDNSRDYSPTITENEDDEPEAYSRSHHNSNGGYSQPHHSHHPPHISQSSLRRPSLASQRTASFSDITSTTPQLRLNTNRSNPAISSRLALGSLSKSQSDLHLTAGSGSVESPTGSLGGLLPASLAAPSSPVSVAPMSPIRSSLEAAGFPRLRSRSEVDTGSHADNIREARRKFEERERAKEEKYAREAIKKRERRDTKEAHRIEKEAAQWKKEAVRPAASRKSTPTNLSTASTPGSGTPSAPGFLAASDSSKNDAGSGKFFSMGTTAATSTNKDCRLGKQAAEEGHPEKEMTFISHNYDSVPGQAPPAFGARVDDAMPTEARPRRGSSAKKRTQSYWHGFILWLRTKLLRFGGR